MADKLRVVVWSTGTVGKLAIAGVDARPDLDLVGVWVSNPEKDGKDVGKLADLGRELGVTATHDKQALLDLKPDAIVHCAMTDDRSFEALDDLIGFVDAGVNVVSSGPVMMLYPMPGMVPDETLSRLAEAGERTGASLHINGIDPGFANDVLPLALSSLSRRVDEIRVLEIADYGTYYQPVVMRDLYGFGKPLDAQALLWEPGILSVAWGPVVKVIADGLGLDLDPELKEEVEKREATASIDTASVAIEEGTLGAVRFSVTGTVNGVPRVVLEHYTRTHEDQCPDWPQPPGYGGGYRVEIKGEPMMTVDLSHQGEFGDHNVSGMVMTAQRLVNCVPAVVQAKGGLVTALDLPLVTGKYAVPTE